MPPPDDSGAEIPASLSDQLRRRLLELRETHPLPRELAGPVPREDVWGETGYLNQPRYHSVIKPMLLRGYATVGVVYNHHLTRLGDGEHSATAEYAWLDARGNLRTDVIHEEYDAFHAALSSGRGDIVFNVDAGLGPGKVITLLHHPDMEMHMIYEALCADPEWQRKADRSYRVFHLRWESGTEGPRALGSREPEDPPQFVLEKREGPHAGWWLLHGETVVLRTRTERPLAEDGTVRLLDAWGGEEGRVEVAHQCLRLTTTSGATFFLTEEPGNMWMVRDSVHRMRVMTVLPGMPAAHLWQCVPRDPLERSQAELFMLAFVAAYDGPPPFRGARRPSLVPGG